MSGRKLDRAPSTHAAAARAIGFELAGVAAILITVSATVGLPPPGGHSAAESTDRERAAVTTASRIDRASLDTDTAQHARRPDSAHRATRTEAGTLSQDSLAKRRDPAAQAPHTLPKDSVTKRRTAATRARPKPRDSIKAHSAPPTSTVVP